MGTCPCRVSARTQAWAVAPESRRLLAMYSGLVPIVMTLDADCHRCPTALATGDRAWQVTAAGGERAWLCLTCARPHAASRPGLSAELEAMRRMLTEPVVQPARARPAPRISSRAPLPVQMTPMPRRVRRAVPPTVRRWRRLLVLSLVTVFATSPLSAAGPVGQALEVVIGFSAVAVFWVSVIGLLVASLRARWTSRRTPVPESWPPRGSMSMDPALPSRRTTARAPVRIAGAEDNWVKGVRGEHAVGAALDATGLPVLHDRRLRVGSAANVDHLVVAADAVYVVDAKNLTGSLSAIRDQLRIGGRERGNLLAGVRRQAEEVAAAMPRLGITAPVRPVLCMTGTARPAGMQLVEGVLLSTPESVASLLALPGQLDATAQARIADLLAWVFPPAAEVRGPRSSLPP
jgi:hypothetical protein